jgi:hypothetical protein
MKDAHRSFGVSVPTSSCHATGRSAASSALAPRIQAFGVQFRTDMVERASERHGDDLRSTR